MTLLPACLEDYVAEDNPVRVVEAFVDQLELGRLGFEGTVPATTGRPSYHPAVLLKIYIYGYLNRVQSSRRLERETQRNVELMWLSGRLTPDFKTIADFRRDNGKAIRQVCRKLDELAAMDTADRIQPDVAEAKTSRLKEKIAKLKGQMQDLKAMEQRLHEAPDGQVSLTDPDARSMATSGRGTGVVGYNVQTAVDDKHHLIVAHEVTNVGHDRAALATMAEQARAATGIEDLNVVADRGYFSGEEILACEQSGITAYVPKPLTSNSAAEGRFGKQDFVYEADEDEYRCPGGQRLIKRFTSIEKGMTLHSYWSSACQGCVIKARCTTGTERRIKRWEHEAVIDAMQRRLDREPEKMRARRQTAEHPFGTIKFWMGAAHFLTRTLTRVSTEMSLHVLAYNLKRAMKILGIGPLMAVMRV
jgi:transposase